MPNARFFATTAKGVEPVLAKELKGLGVENLKTARGGVHFEGSMETLYRTNLWLRTANRVLMQLAVFPCPTPQVLYQNARDIRWSDWISAQQTLAVDCNCRDSAITHSHYAAQKIKDAVVDRIRDSTGSRPNVDTRNPDIRVNAHIANDTCVLSLDASGMVCTCEAIAAKRWMLRFGKLWRQLSLSWLTGTPKDSSSIRCVGRVLS